MTIRSPSTLTIVRKQAELNAIVQEIESERARRVLADPTIRQARTERRLLLERELAAVAGDEYADQLRVDYLIGDEWHVVSNLGRETALICGDVGASTSVVFLFRNTEIFCVSGLNDDFDEHPLNGKGLGHYGLYVVRNSRWKRDLLEAAASSGSERKAWSSGFEHWILRGKGGELSCLAKGYQCQLIRESIELIRERAVFWKELGIIRVSDG